MAEIDIMRADGVIFFNGEPVADVRSDIAPSILEAFYVLAESKAPKELESKLRQIRELCDE